MTRSRLSIPKLILLHCVRFVATQSFQMVLHSDTKSDGAVQKSPTLIQNSTALLCFIDVDTDCCVSRLTCRKALCHQFVKKR